MRNKHVKKAKEVAGGLFGFCETEHYSSGGGNHTDDNHTGKAVVTQMALNSLEPRHMLKGEIINLFASHLDYVHGQEKDPDIESLSVDFWDYLTSYGAEETVKKWGIDPFERKIICMPACVGCHWRLVVLLNPARVLENCGYLCCILGLDSLTGDERLIKSKAPLIRDWLNRKWNKCFPNKKEDPFTAGTMPSFAPSVPKQGSGIGESMNDCGIHTMLAMRMMYKMRGKDFLASSGTDDAWFTKDLRKISKSDGKYGDNEVIRLRKDTAEFIRRLSNCQKELRMASSAVGEDVSDADDDDDSCVLEVCSYGENLCRICGSGMT